VNGLRLLLRRLWRALFWTVLAFVLGSVLLVVAFRWVPPPTSAFILARHLDVMRGAAPALKIRHQWVPRERIAPALLVAVVAAEDQLFPQHHGFDFKAIGKALDEAGKRGPRGASTISQQVAKNLFLWSGRSWLRKGLEAWFTVLIEAAWPKRRILEVYVNFAEFGDGIYGAQAAARFYFARDAGVLSNAQAARLAAVLPSPRHYSVARPGPYVLSRQRWIERQMIQLGGQTYLAEILRD